jgi:hypothetical protein
MNRTFTFLWVLLISVTLSAQKSRVAYPETPESPASKFQREFLKQLDNPGQLSEPESFKDTEHELHVESGRPFAGLKEANAARLAPVAAKQRLDSIVGSKTKTVYEYDEDGNVTSAVEYMRDTVTGPWTLNLKEETSFDENGRTSVDAGYHWDDSLKQWIGDWKYEYTRDEDGRQTGWTSFEWDTDSGQWINTERYAYSYNEYGARATLDVHEWDTVLNEWVGVYTEQYNFDENGNVTSSTSSWEWDPVGKKFKPGFRMEFTRNDSGLVTSWIESQWNPVSGKWVNTQKGDNTYDENGNTTSNVWSNWDTISNQWVLLSKYDYTYDAEGDQTSSISAFWNADSNKWDLAQKWEYIYESKKSGSSIYSVSAGKKLLTTIVYYLFPPDLWIPLYRIDVTYNGEGEIILRVYSDWNPADQEYVETQKEQTDFNGSGFVIFRSYSVWNEESSEFQVQTQSVYTYDANNHRTSSAYYSRDQHSGQLVGTHRTDLTPDIYGNNLAISYYVWNLILNDWVGLSRYVYTYDYAFLYADLWLPFYVQHKILQYIAYAFTGAVPLKSDEDDWEQNDLFIYYYSDLAVSGVSDISRGELSIYPNPATDFIQVEGDLDTDPGRVMMYNVSGKMVMNQVLDHGGRIPVSHLSKGIYVIRLTQGSKVKTAKVMIQ